MPYQYNIKCDLGKVGTTNPTAPGGVDTIPCDQASVGQIKHTTSGGKGTMLCDLRREGEVNPGPGYGI